MVWSVCRRPAAAVHEYHFAIENCDAIQTEYA